MQLTKSKIFLYFCLAFILSVAFASFVEIPLHLLGIFLIGVILVIMIYWQEKWELVVLAFCLIFALAGMWRFQAKSAVPENDISKYNEKGNIVFNGVISKEPDNRIENQKLVIDVKEVRLSQEVELPKIEASKIEGKVLITAEKYPEYEYGDKLEISGQLKEPANFFNDAGELFDYQAYLAKDDIYSIIYYPDIEIAAKGRGNLAKAGLFWIKNKFEQNLSSILPEPQISLASGLILGERATLPEDLMKVFSVVGITHIIALSGFNITIIAESLRKLFNYLMLSRHYSFWAAVACIAGFVVMTGASASVVRAAVMGLLVLLAQKTGRLYSIRNALVFAGAVMIFVNPKILRFDASFQLSFLATLGLVYIAPFFEKYFLWLPEAFGLRGIAGATMGAQTAVLPLILYNFGKLSLVAPMANILVLPFIPLTMLLSFVSGVLTWIWVGLGEVAGWPAWLFLTYQIKVAEWLAKVPLAAIDVKISWILLVVMYVVLWGTIIRMTKRQWPRCNEI